MYFRFWAFFESLLVLLSYNLSIQPFRCGFFIVIFQSKIVWVHLHPVFGMFLCHLLQVVDKIFFRCFGMSCFICIVLLFVVISIIILLSPVLSDLSSHFALLFFLVLNFCSYIPASFFCFMIFDQFS